MQIVEKSGKGTPTPYVVRFSVGTIGAIRYDEMHMFSVGNTNRPELFAFIRGNILHYRRNTYCIILFL